MKKLRIANEVRRNELPTVLSSEDKNGNHQDEPNGAWGHSETTGSGVHAADRQHRERLPGEFVEHYVHVLGHQAQARATKEGAMNFLERALPLAKKGIHVFPLIPRDKLPLTAHGVKDATTNRK